MSKVISVVGVEQKIFLIRAQRVMLDFDLAVLYGVATKRLNEQVKRNLKRFPGDFMFQLSDIEKQEVVANCDHLKALRFSYVNPYTFTEQGIAMLSSVLNSERAIEVNIAIMRAFVKLREILATHKELADRLGELERRMGKKDQEVMALFEAIRKLMTPPPEKKKRPISIFTETQKTDSLYGGGLLSIRNKMLTPQSSVFAGVGFIVDGEVGK